MLAENVKIVKVAAATATATTDISSAVVDTQGYDGVLFVTTIATAAAGNYMKIVQGSDGTVSDAADIKGTKAVAAADGGVVFNDVHKAGDRYVQAVVKRGTTTIVGEIYAILYKGNKVPETNVRTGYVGNKVNAAIEEAIS